MPSLTLPSETSRILRFISRRYSPLAAMGALVVYWPPWCLEVHIAL